MGDYDYYNNPLILERRIEELLDRLSNVERKLTSKEILFAIFSIVTLLTISKGEEISFEKQKLISLIHYAYLSSCGLLSVTFLKGMMEKIAEKNSIKEKLDELNFQKKLINQKDNK